MSGVGKTTFALDCLKSIRYTSPFIYIDTIEYFSEKLISIFISQQIHGILKNIASSLHLPKNIQK